ncbi:hypothetical protein TNCV_3858241 [Trichonephila clavipes]|nr:hypothetical protein TNCV_3858241 [Trichonephila clavipes]
MGQKGTLRYPQDTIFLLTDTAHGKHSGWIRAHYEQLSEFERGRIIELKEGGWANWRIARHMGRSDGAIRRC